MQCGYMANAASVTLASHLSAGELESLRARPPLEEIGGFAISLAMRFEAGAEAGLIHLLANWGRRALTRDVVFESDPTAMDGLQQPLELPYVLGAAFCGRTFYSGPQRVNITSALRQSLRKHLSGTQLSFLPRKNIQHGTAILCKDSSPIPLSPRLYVFRDDVPEMRGVETFEALFRELTSGENAILPLFSRDEVSGVEEGLLPTIVYELFRNTHDHARTLSDGRRNPFSLRGIYVKLHAASRSGVTNPLDRALSQYLSGLGRALQLSASSAAPLLEVSIFDSGPGLAQHRSGKSLASFSLAEERRWLEACFARFSSGVPGEPQRGLGLERVQKALTRLRGFLHVRSGRLSLFRDFCLLPFQDRVAFFDFETLGSNLQEKPQVDGALFTILIPSKQLA